MSPLKAAALFVGLGALPILSLARVAGNDAWSAPIVPMSAALTFVAVATPLALIAVAVIRFLPRWAARTVSSLGWATLAFVHFGPLRPSIYALGLVESWHWHLIAMATIGLGVWIGTRFDTAARYLVTLVPLLVLMQLVQLGLESRRWDEPPPASVSSPASDLGDPPGMWIIVLDSHASPRTLRDIHEIDIASPIDDLEASGFVVWDDARTAYSRTLVAVPSILSGAVFEPPALEDVLPEILAGMHADTPLLAGLQEAGHMIRVAPANWSRSGCGTLADECITTPAPTEHWFFLLATTPLPDMFRRLLAHPHPTGGLETLDAVRSLEDEDRHVTFIHSMVSHPPLILDADCRPRSATKGSLADQLQCTHDALGELLTSIDLESDIVIITSDHGYGDPAGHPEEWTDDEVRNRFSAFTAISTPDDCAASLPERLSGPQILPLVLNCYGAELAVPDHHFAVVVQRRDGTLEALPLDWDGWSTYGS